MMASLITKLWTRVRAKRAPISIMIVGLDNSGKTSILNSLSISNQSSNSMSSYQSSSEPSTSVTAKEFEGSLSVPSGASINNGSISYTRGTNIMPTVGYNYERLQYKGLTFTILDFSGQNRYRNLWQEFYNGVDAIVFVIDSSDPIRLVVVRDELETMLSHPYFSTLREDSVTYKLTGVSLTAQKQITISQGRLVQTPLNNNNNKTPTALTTNRNDILSQQQQSRKGNPRRRTKVPILFMANKTDLANSVDTVVIVKALNLSQLPSDRHPWFIQATSVNLNQGIVEGFDWLVSQLANS